VHLRFPIHVPEQATSLRVGDLFLRVHPYAAHERHIEHQRAVGRGQACNIVSSAFDAEQEFVIARKLHGRDHVGDAEAARDGGGLSIDHGVPNASGLFIADVARHEHRPLETHLQPGQSVLPQLDLTTFQRFRFQRSAPLK
jgi:hypothetical protein